MSSPTKFVSIHDRSAHSTLQSSPDKTFLGSPSPLLGKYSEIPLDSQAQYKISYANGLVQHEIQKAQTLEEAQMKIIMLSCELERLGNFNYKLVKENEVLRAQTAKTNREKDLETKLSIVLAENGKLTDCLNDVYEAYTRQKSVEIDRSELNNILDQSVEEWREKYSKLEIENSGLQNTIKDLQNNHLNAQQNILADLQQKLSALNTENEGLKREVQTLRVQLEGLNGIQVKSQVYQDKIQELLAVNNQLNESLREKSESEAYQKSKTIETTLMVNRLQEDVKKAGAVSNNMSEIQNRLKILTEENTFLQKQINASNQELESYKSRDAEMRKWLLACPYPVSLSK